MQSDALTVDGYLETLPGERRLPMRRILEEIRHGIPPGFEEAMGYGMIMFSVPLARYPKGYHVGQGVPLPFIGLASQKRHISFYHMGLYADPALMAWFEGEYARAGLARRLDKGKSCLRFSRMDKIPLRLIGELSGRISVDEWIRRYEASRK